MGRRGASAAGRGMRACALACLIALGAAGPLGAQAVANPPQIVTLDQDRLYLDSQYGKALEAQSLAANQALAAENRKIEADLAAEEADLTKKRPTMSAAAFQSLADAFDAKVEQRRREQAAKVDALKAQHDAGRKSFFQAVVPVLADLMRQMGAYAMLNRDAVVLSFDAIDVTDRAIKAVDDKVGDGSSLPGGPRVAGPGQPGTDGYVTGTPMPETPQPVPPAAPGPAPAQTPDAQTPDAGTPDAQAPDAGTSAPQSPAPDLLSVPKP
ncbi:OmpH family outer membrane protein [bacterium]|nr:OmpH family outer membrane protein [bacterium]